jgi:hypothetical protein
MQYIPWILGSIIVLTFSVTIFLLIADIIGKSPLPAGSLSRGFLINATVIETVVGAIFFVLLVVFYNPPGQDEVTSGDDTNILEQKNVRRYR